MPQGILFILTIRTYILYFIKERMNNVAVRKTEKGWYVEVYLGTNPITGKKIRKTRTFKKQKEAKDWELEILQAYKTGTLNLKGNMKLGEYLEYWFDTYALVNTAEPTQKRYRSFIECINKHLGHVTLDKLKTSMIDEFYANLKKETKTLKNGKTKRKYMDGTILKTHKLLREALDKAVGWEVIGKNPADYATPPADDEREINTWTIEETNQFLDKIRDTIIYLPVLIAYHTGLRIGEVCALRWEDINLKDGYLTVRHTIVEKKGSGLVLKEPKTESSKANVALTKELHSMLKSALSEQKKHKLKTGIELEYVCCWEDGRPLRPTYVSKAFTKYVKKYGMKKITFHGLRHSHATILFTYGATSQEISKRLRHSRVSTTDDIYIHVTDKIKKSTAELFDKALDQSK